jgi:hypothetical protein
LNNLAVIGLAISLLGTAQPGGFQSGLQVGERSGACLAATVVAGGGDMTYGCMTCTAAPAAPVLIIFTQKVDENVARLVRAIHPKVAAWGSGKGPRAFLCGIGPVDEKQLLKLGEPGNVALTIPRSRDQLDKYKLDKDAAVTVIVYDRDRDHKVTANFAFRETAELSKAKIQEVVQSLDRSAAKPPEENRQRR